MSALMEPITRYQDLLHRLCGSDLPGAGIDWLETLRRQAATRFEQLAFPGRRDESWRYTSLQGLLEQELVPAEPFKVLRGVDIEDAMIPDLDAWRLTFVNGRFAPRLSWLHELPTGVRLKSLRGVLHAASGDLRGRLARAEVQAGNLFSAFNTAAFADGAYVHVERERMLERPIEILHLSVGMEEPHIAQPRHLVRLEQGARAHLIERHFSFGNAPYFNNAVTEVQLDTGSSLHHARIQEESAQAFHMNSQFVQHAAGSSYHGTGVALGGAWSRNEIRVDLEGEAASCDLRGLYVVGDGQLSDQHLDVQHRVPGCASREDFRGILNGRGRGVFDGRIRVEKDAQKSDAQLSNANLLLSRQAEIDTKPQLEILADDVKCAHGTTVGQIEGEALFYMQSRGIRRRRAQQLICLGFARTAFENSGIEALDRYLEKAVAQRLNAEVTS
jgi:Fe-S cluster assembly protein SufD